MGEKQTGVCGKGAYSLTQQASPKGPGCRPGQAGGLSSTDITKPRRFRNGREAHRDECAPWSLLVGWYRGWWELKQDLADKGGLGG